MKLFLLLSLGLTLVCARKQSSEVVKSDYDLSKIKGEWYSILLASDQKDKIDEGGSMRIFVKSMDIWDNGTLYLVYHGKENGQCTEFSMACDKTEKNGQFFIDYDGANVFEICETDYSRYLMFHLVNTKNGKTYQTRELYARTPNVSKRLKRKFKNICMENGIIEENILDLTESDRCLEARKSG